MPAPVWVLSVDLQTKTAAFVSGLGDASRAARGAFSEIKDGASGAGREVSYSMTEARHSVHLITDEFGIHIPRALTSFVAGLGPIGPALEAAFPFLAIVVGATLLLEHLAKLKEEGEKLTEAQLHFAAVVANVMNGLNDKLLEAGIKTDELNHDHIAALAKQLELIDHASLSELERSFETVAKAADLTFAQLKSSWYTFGTGSTGAKHALEEFKSEYDKLLALGKDKEASDLLAGTLKSAERIRELQNQAAASHSSTDTNPDDAASYAKHAQAVTELKRAGTGYTQKEVEAQETLLEALRAQVEVEEKVNALKQAQESNAIRSEAAKEQPEVIRLRRGIDEMATLHKREQKEAEEALLAQLHANDAFQKAMDREQQERERKSEAAANKQLQYEEHIAELRKKAHEKTAREIAESEYRLEAEIARGLSSVLMRHQSFASMMNSLGEQVVSGMLQSLLTMETVQGRKRLADARTAAANAYEWGWEHGGPAAPVLSVALGAGAFAAAMAFEEGGIVPGTGRGDVVPARLTPGEAVIPKQMTERLSRAADDGDNKRGDVHVHYRPTYHVSAIDGASVRGMLREHSQEFSNHLHSEIRKLNR